MNEWQPVVNSLHLEDDERGLRLSVSEDVDGIRFISECGAWFTLNEENWKLLHNWTHRRNNARAAEFRAILAKISEEA